MVSTAAGHRRIIQHHLDSDQDLGNPDRPQVDWSRLMELGVREIVTFLGMAVSVGASLSIVKTKLQGTIDKLDDIETRLRQIDRETDQQEVVLQTHEQKLAVMSSMLAPSEREKKARETASILVEIQNLRRDIDHQMSIHNGRHPDIK